MNESSSKPSAMKRDWTLTQEAFDQFLARLDVDRERAGEKYEEIRRWLTKYFEFHGGSSPSDLPDETIDRVARRIDEKEQVRNLNTFIKGTARIVLLEDWRRQKKMAGPIEGLPPDRLPIEPSTEKVALEAERLWEEETRSECMRRCLKELPPEQSYMMRQYHLGEKSARIKNRRMLAEQLGITPGALRQRVLKIGNGLKACPDKCLDQHPIEG